MLYWSICANFVPAYKVVVNAKFQYNSKNDIEFDKTGVPLCMCLQILTYYEKKRRKYRKQKLWLFMRNEA